MNVSLIVINIEVILWDSCQFKGYNGITQGLECPQGIVRPLVGLVCIQVQMGLCNLKLKGQLGRLSARVSLVCHGTLLRIWGQSRV